MGRAALLAARGDLTGAENALVTLLAGALQMARNAPFEVDVVEALDLLRWGLISLAEVVEAREGERPVWAERIDQEPPSRWSRGHRTDLFSDDPAAVFDALPRIVRDEAIPHAFKRFAYRQVVVFDVCLGLEDDRRSRRALRAWRSAVEDGLVRRPSDKDVLETMRSGVRNLLLASDVSPETVCAPSVVVSPRVGFTIMTSPLRSTSRDGITLPTEELD